MNDQEKMAMRLDVTIEKLKNLAVRLLDSDGIMIESYTALLDCLPELFALELNRRVEAQDGVFYLPENHDLGEWRIKE